MNEPIFACFTSLLIAMTVAISLNPRLVSLSYRKNLTDNPNHRKLQKQPVPILGGMSVFLGTTLGTLFLNLWMDASNLYMVTLSLMIMFFIGLMDDLTDLRARTKFFFQIMVTAFLWWNGIQIESFTGLFGIYELPQWFSLALSVVAGVGLMNAINMIDGVDGLSSGFGIGTSVICGLFFFLHGDYIYAAFASIFVGSLMPFFFCNVFCRKYKMFIGDSGSLVMGTVAYIFVCNIIQTTEMFSIDKYRIAMTIAIFSIPVTDTLRVMTMRMIHLGSPFSPDKTHLHHIFVDLKFPHIAITIIELFMATVIFLMGWGVSALFGLSITSQFIITVFFACFISWGTYSVLAYIRDHKKKQFYRYGEFVIGKTQWLIVFRQKIQILVERR